jgi:hypothetical protein
MTYHDTYTPTCLPIDSLASEAKYKARLASAIEWIQENPTEKAVNDAINKAKKALIEEELTLVM